MENTKPNVPTLPVRLTTRAVYKYGVAIGESTSVTMPKGTRIVDFEYQPGTGVNLWGLLEHPQNDYPKETVERAFIVVGTGRAWTTKENEEAKYVGTAVTETGEVWHCFEIIPGVPAPATPKA